MITRSSIAFEDFLGSSIAPQVMPPWTVVHLSPSRRGLDSLAPVVGSVVLAGHGGEDLAREARLRGDGGDGGRLLDDALLVLGAFLGDGRLA